MGIALIIPLGWLGVGIGMVLAAAYVTVLEGTTGHTLGAAAVGLRVVDRDSGGRIGYGRALGCTLGRLLSAAPLLAGYLWILRKPGQQAWHDKLTRTSVISLAQPAETVGWRRSVRWLVLVGATGALAGVLALNTLLVDEATKPARADSGTLVATPWGAMQVRQDGPPNGPPLVLLHGWTASLHWWDRITPLLASRYRVICIDLMGFGGSAKPASGYSMPDEGRDVAYVLGRLGVHDATVVGHSMGGPVAVATAEASPSLVRRLVLIDPVSTHGNSRPTPLLSQLYFEPVFGELASRLTTAPVIRSEYREGFAPGYHIDPALGDQLVRDFHATTYRAVLATAKASGEYRRTEALDQRIARLGLPLLVVFGSEDQFSFADRAPHEYSPVPGVRIVVMPGAGHSPQIEKPEATANLIRSFVGT